jgi:hypothetical protein
LNRKLLILNILLAIAVIYTGVELRSQYVAAKARQAHMPGPAPKAPPVAPVAPLPTPSAVLPSGYKDVALNTLFDPSRNPNLPVPEPPKPAPPPEPPPLPSYHGMINFGDAAGPVALINPADGSGHQEVHAGEMTGAFKLVAFDRQEMALEWEGRTFHKRLGDEGGGQPKARAAGAIAPINDVGVIPGQAPKNAVEAPRQQGSELGPGVEMTDTVKACQAGDSSPAGAVNGGYRKEVNVSPMGSQCIWRAIGK